jgi:hypothetical protein
MPIREIPKMIEERTRGTTTIVNAWVNSVPNKSYKEKRKESVGVRLPAKKARIMAINTDQGVLLFVAFM